MAEQTGRRPFLHSCLTPTAAAMVHQLSCRQRLQAARTFFKVEFSYIAVLAPKVKACFSTVSTLVSILAQPAHRLNVCSRRMGQSKSSQGFESGVRTLFTLKKCVSVMCAVAGSYHTVSLKSTLTSANQGQGRAH
jgi:hypothetical protein